MPCCRAHSGSRSTAASRQAALSRDKRRWPCAMAPGACPRASPSPVRDALPSQVIVTSAQTLRGYSQYNETSHARYVLEDAQRRGMPRAMLERDAKLLSIDVGVDGRLDFQGRADFRPAEGGRGERAARHRDRGAGRWRGRHAWHEQLLRQHAQRLRRVAHQRGRSGPQLRHRRRQCADVRVAGSQRHVADGALLRAPQVFVSAGGITLEAGAAIDTIGAGRAYDSAEGYLYSPGRSAVLALSNGLITMLAPDAPQGPRAIRRERSRSAPAPACAPGPPGSTPRARWPRPPTAASSWASRPATARVSWRCR